MFTDSKNHINYRVLNLLVEEEVQEELEASLIALARHDISVTQILKGMRRENIVHIKVKKLESKKFLISFPSRKEKDSMDLGWLDLWL